MRRDIAYFTADRVPHSSPSQPSVPIIIDFINPPKRMRIGSCEFWQVFYLVLTDIGVSGK